MITHKGKRLPLWMVVPLALIVFALTFAITTVVAAAAISAVAP